MSNSKRVSLAPSIGHWLGRRDMFSSCSPSLHLTFEDGNWRCFSTPVQDREERDWIVPDDFEIRYQTGRVLEAWHPKYGKIRISLKTRKVTILDQTTDKNVSFTFITEAVVSGSAVSDTAVLPDSLVDNCSVSHSSRVNPKPFESDVRCYVERKILERTFQAHSQMWECSCEGLWIDMENILSELLSGKKQRNGRNEVYPESQRKLLWSAWWKIIEPAQQEIEEIYESYRNPKNVLIQSLTARNRAKRKERRKESRS